MSSAGTVTGLVVALVAAGTVLGGASTAQATPGQPGWLKGASSVHADPGDVVAAAPAPEDLLEVVVTTATPSGPRFTTVPADDVAEAEQIVEEAQADPDTDAVSMAAPGEITATDTYRADQWALDTLRAETARTLARGTGVVVAVVDTGVQSAHPDLSGRVLGGIRTVDGTGSQDDNGHGTHVAGIIAAVAGNGRGVAGLADGARILPVKVFGADGRGSSVDIAEGVTAAVNAGADVINLSLTIRGSESALRSAIAYAISKGVVVVAAAGNSPCPLLSPVYPADYPDVLGAGSVAKTGAPSTFLCRGGWVDLSAPGTSILSTWKGSTYRYASGTSMATPHVSAAAAAVIQRVGAGWTRRGVESLLVATATDKGAAGLDAVYGHGLVNPVAALRRASTTSTVTVPTTAVVSGSSVPVTGRIVSADGSAVAGVQAVLGATLDGQARTWPVTTDGSGRFSVAVEVPHQAELRVRFPGGATQRASTAAATVKVKPRLARSAAGTEAELRVETAYGQKVSLQRKDGTRWLTVSSTTATTHGQRWVVRTARGTFRFVSHSSTRLTAAMTSAWTS